MNKTVVLSIVRHLLTFAGGALAARGVANAEEVEQGIGALMTLIGLGLSIYEKRNRPAAPLPPGTLALLFLLVPMGLLFGGCGSFRNVQEDRSVVINPDGTREERNIVSRQSSRSFFDSKASLRGFSVSQTDKSQSTQLRGLDQQTSGTGAVQVLKIVVEGATKAALP
jgi:hypothetical protein